MWSTYTCSLVLLATLVSSVRVLHGDEKYRHGGAEAITCVEHGRMNISCEFPRHAIHPEAPCNATDGSCWISCSPHCRHYSRPQHTCTLRETKTYCGYTPLNIDDDPPVYHGVWDQARCLWLPDHSDVDRSTCPTTYFIRNCTDQEFHRECTGDHDIGCFMACDRYSPTKCRIFGNVCEHLRNATEWEREHHCASENKTHSLIMHVSVQHEGLRPSPHTPCHHFEQMPHVSHFVKLHQRILKGDIPTYYAHDQDIEYPHYHIVTNNTHLKEMKGRYTKSVKLLRKHVLHAEIHSFECKYGFQPLNGTCSYNYTTYGSTYYKHLEICGPFATQVTVGVLNGTATPIESSCICRPGYYPGDMYACQNPYYSRMCTPNEAYAHARHSAMCPKPYTCFMLCDNDGCFRYKDDSCLDTVYPTTCNLYDAQDICGMQYTSCQGNCYISSNISFPMVCDLTTLQCFKDGVYTPYPSQQIPADYVYTPPTATGLHTIQHSWMERVRLNSPTSKPIHKLRHSIFTDTKRVRFLNKQGKEIGLRSTSRALTLTCGAFPQTPPTTCNGAYSVPCNASEVVSRCGNQALSCTKTCCPNGSCYPPTAANLPLQQCNCTALVAGASIGIGVLTGYCAQAFTGDACTIKQKCGPFTNASYHLIDACGDQYDYCICHHNASSLLIGDTLVQCAGYPRPCEQAEALAACGPVGNSSAVDCTAFCTADKSICRVDTTTCAVSIRFQVPTVLTRNCFPYESSLYCGEGVTVCLVNSQTQAFINGSCICNPPTSIFDRKYRFSNDPNGVLRYPCVYTTNHVQVCNSTQRGRCGYSSVKGCNARHAFVDLSVYNQKSIRFQAAFQNQAGGTSFFVLSDTNNPILQSYDPFLYSLFSTIVSQVGSVGNYIQVGYSWNTAPSDLATLWVNYNIYNSNQYANCPGGVCEFQNQYQVLSQYATSNVYQRVQLYTYGGLGYLIPPVMQRGTAFAGWDSMWFVECSCSGVLDPAVTILRSEYDPSNYNGYFWATAANAYRQGSRVYQSVSPVAWDQSAPYVANLACDANTFFVDSDTGVIPTTDTNPKTWQSSDTGATPCHGSNRACSSIFDVDLLYATSSAVGDAFGSCATAGQSPGSVSTGNEVYVAAPYTLTSQVSSITCGTQFWDPNFNGNSAYRNWDGTWTACQQPSQQGAVSAERLYMQFPLSGSSTCSGSSISVPWFTGFIARWSGSYPGSVQLRSGNTVINLQTHSCQASDCNYEYDSYCGAYHLDTSDPTHQQTYASASFTPTTANVFSSFPSFSSLPTARTQSECDLASQFCTSFTDTTNTNIKQSMILPCGGLGVAQARFSLPTPMIKTNAAPTGYSSMYWQYFNTMKTSMPNYVCKGSTNAQCSSSTLPIAPWCTRMNGIPQQTAPNPATCNCYNGFGPGGVGGTCSQLNINFPNRPAPGATVFYSDTFYASFCNVAGEYNGKLNYTSASCQCDPHWSLDGATHCHTPTCPLGSNNLFCSGVGTCSGTANACICPQGYGGTACNIFLSSTCPAVDQQTGTIYYYGDVQNLYTPGQYNQLTCNGRGYCNITGNCVCQSGAIWYWTGTACTTPNIISPGCLNGGVIAANTLYNALYNTSSALYCRCDNPRYTGVFCEIDTAPVFNGTVCNNLTQPVCSSPGVCSCPCPQQLSAGVKNLRAGCACEYDVGAACVQSSSLVVCNYATNTYPVTTNRIPYIIPTPAPNGDTGYQACQPYYTYSNQTNVYPTIAYACVCPDDRYGQFCENSYCATPNGFPNPPTNGPCNGLQCVCQGPGVNCTCNCANQQVYASPQTAVGSSGAGYHYYIGQYCQVDVAAQCGIVTSTSQITLCSGTNSGTCVFNSTTTQYGCSCGQGYVGAYCQNTYCQAPCGTYGTCTPPQTGNAYYCVCNPNSVYTNLGSLTTPCNRSTCQAPSIPSADATKCVCNDTSYSPPTCQYKYCPTQNGIECGAPMQWDGLTSAGRCVSGVCDCTSTAPYYFFNTTTRMCDTYCNRNSSRTTGAVPNQLGTITCQCSGGYDSATGCNTLYCQNGGILTQSTTCVCTGVYTGTQCTQSRCVQGVPATNGSVCLCNAGFTGQYCDQRICYNRGTVGNPTTGNCTCPFLFGGADCNTTLPPPVFNCSNGGISNYTACNCTANYTGLHCDFPYCSNFGYRVSSTSACTCVGRWGLGSSGNCTINLCGLFGAPSTDGQSCVCSSSFVYNSSATNSACQLPCATGSTWNSITSSCICPPLKTGTLCNVNVTIPVFVDTSIPAPSVVQSVSGNTPSALSLTTNNNVTYLDALTLPQNGYLCVAGVNAGTCLSLPATSAPAQLPYAPGIVVIIFVSTLTHYAGGSNCNAQNTSFQYKYIDKNNTMSTNTGIYTLSVTVCSQPATSPTPSPTPTPVPIITTSSSSSGISSNLIIVIAVVPSVLVVFLSIYVAYSYCKAHPLHHAITPHAAPTPAAAHGTGAKFPKYSTLKEDVDYCSDEDD